MNPPNPPNYQFVQPSYIDISYSQNQSIPTNYTQMSTSSALGEAADRYRYLPQNNKTPASATDNFYDTPLEQYSNNLKSSDNKYSLSCPIENIQSLLLNYPQETQQTEDRSYNLRSRTKNKPNPSHSGLRRSQSINSDIPPNVTITPNMSNNLRHLQSRESHYKTRLPVRPNQKGERSVTNDVESPRNGFYSNERYAAPQSIAIDLTKQSPKPYYIDQNSMMDQFRAQRLSRHQDQETFLNRQATQSANFGPGVYQGFNPNINLGTVGKFMVPKQNGTNSLNANYFPNGEESLYQNMLHTPMYDRNGLSLTNCNEMYASDLSQTSRNGTYIDPGVMNHVRSSYEPPGNIQSNATGRSTISGVLNHSIEESQGRIRKYTPEEIGICQTMLSLSSGQDNRPYSAISPYQPDKNDYEKLNGSGTPSGQDQIYGSHGLGGLQNNGYIMNGLLQGYPNHGYGCVAMPNNPENAIPIDFSRFQAPPVPHPFCETCGNPSCMHPYSQRGFSAMQPPAAPYECHDKNNNQESVKKTRGRKPKNSKQESPAQCPVKRTRTTFDSYKQRILEEHFQENPYISKADRVKLADLLGVKEKQIKIWYQNRRMRERKKNRELQGNGQLLRGRKRRTLDGSSSPAVSEQPSQQEDRQSNSAENSVRTPSSSYQESAGQDQKSPSSSGSVEIMQNYPSDNSALTRGIQTMVNPIQHLSEDSPEKFEGFGTSPSTIIGPHESNQSVTPQTQTLIKKSANSVESLQPTLNTPYEVSRKYQNVSPFEPSEARKTTAYWSAGGLSAANSNQYMHISQQEWPRSTQVQVNRSLDSAEYMQRIPCVSYQETYDHQNQGRYHTEPADVRTNFPSYNSYLSNGGSLTVNSLPILHPQNIREKRDLEGNNISRSIYPPDFHHNVPAQIYQNVLSSPYSFGSSQVSPLIPYQTANNVQNTQQRDRKSHHDYREQNQRSDQVPARNLRQEVFSFESEEMRQLADSCFKNNNSLFQVPKPTVPAYSTEKNVPVFNPLDSIGKFSKNANVNYTNVNQDLHKQHEALNQTFTQLSVSDKAKNVLSAENCCNGQMPNRQATHNNSGLLDISTNVSSNIQNSYSQDETDETLFIGSIDNRKQQQTSVYNPMTRDIRSALLAANNLSNQVIDVPVQQKSFGYSDIYPCGNPNTINTESPVHPSVFQNNIELPTSEAENSEDQTADINDNSIKFTKEMIDLCNKAILNASHANAHDSNLRGLYENEALKNIFNSNESVTPSSVPTEEGSVCKKSTTESRVTTETEEPFSKNGDGQLHQREKFAPKVRDANGNSESDKAITAIISSPLVQDYAYNRSSSTSSESSAVFQVPSNNPVSKVIQASETEKMLQNNLTSASKPTEDETKIKPSEMRRNTANLLTSFSNTDILMDALKEDFGNSVTFRREDSQFDTERFLNGIENMESDSLQTKDKCYVYGGVVIKKEPIDDYSTEFSISVDSRYPTEPINSAKMTCLNISPTVASDSSTFETNAALAYSLTNNTSSASASCAQANNSSPRTSYFTANNACTGNTSYALSSGVSYTGSNYTSSYTPTVDSPQTNATKSDTTSSTYIPYTEPTLLEGSKHALNG